MAHNRHKFLSEFDAQLRDTLLSLVDTCLSGIVEDFILMQNGSTLVERLVSVLLLPTDFINVLRQSGESRDYTRSILAHVGEHRRKHIHISGLSESFEENKKGFVGIPFEQICEVLHIESCDLGIFGRVAVHSGQHLTDSGSRSLHFLSVGVKHGTHTDDVLKGKVSHIADTGKTVGELHKVRLRCGTVLRQNVHDRTDFYH